MKGQEERSEMALGRVAVVGLGNVGRYAVEALRQAPDLELAGVVRRTAGAVADLPGVKVVQDPADLGPVDVALLTVPSRRVPEHARHYLGLGIRTVDSYDIHAEIPALRRELDRLARSRGTVAVLAAGWDPGTDSVIRALLEAMAPRGITYTNFGPGMSMGHTAAVKAIPGVRKALSLTLPAGEGRHRRAVYVELEPGADFDRVESAIQTDPYFVHDETRVYRVENVDDLIDMGHGVVMERKGVSAGAHNQLLRFEMRIHNPALTAQVMVAAARAALRLEPGAYTLVEIPPVDLLPGDRDRWIGRLV